MDEFGGSAHWEEDFDPSRDSIDNEWSEPINLSRAMPAVVFFAILLAHVVRLLLLKSE